MRDWACTACFQVTSERYFVRRNWRTKKWTIVRKYHDVGAGLCRECTIIDANNRNAITEMRVSRQSTEGGGK